MVYARGFWRGENWSGGAMGRFCPSNRCYSPSQTRTASRANLATIMIDITARKQAERHSNGPTVRITS